MKEEIWKHISGLPLGYEVSSLGNARINYDTYTEEIPIKMYNKTPTINVCGKQIKIHRAVAEAFLPNEDNKSWVNHKDGDNTNNCVDNLEWITQNNKMDNAYKSGSFKGITVKCLEDNLIFMTITSAEAFYSIPKYAIEESANTGDVCFGLHFSYVDSLENCDDIICLNKSDYILLSKKLSSTDEIRKLTPKID